jgi:two-component system chemotaxis response regulator CheY
LQNPEENILQARRPKCNKEDAPQFIAGCGVVGANLYLIVFCQVGLLSIKSLYRSIQVSIFSSYLKFVSLLIVPSHVRILGGIKLFRNKKVAMKKEEPINHLVHENNFSDEQGLNYGFKSYNDLQISPTKGQKILIAEKSTFMRVMLTAALEKLGFQVLGSAKDGEKAVDKYHELKPDIMLVDIELDGLDGIDVARAITSEEPAAVVVMLIEETEDMPDIIVESVLAGAKSYIQKPLSESEIVKSISRALRRCHATLN